MKHIIKLSFLFVLAFLSCSKEENISTPTTSEEVFDLREYFAAGTLGTTSGVYTISFLEKGKAILHIPDADFVGTYKVENKILEVKINESENYRIFKFYLNDLNEIRFSYYEEDTPYLATGKLLKINTENPFKNKAFQGTELRMGRPLPNDIFYKFSEDGKKIGFGETLSDITPEYKLDFINSSVFRYSWHSNNSYKGIGFIDGEEVKISSKRGRNTYSGVYNLVK